MGFEQNIQIKIAISKDKLRILIKILAESHMAFDWEIKSPSLTRTLGGRHGFLHIGSLNIIKISKCTLIDIFQRVRLLGWGQPRAWCFASILMQHALK